MKSSSSYLDSAVFVWTFLNAVIVSYIMPFIYRLFPLSILERPYIISIIEICIVFAAYEFVPLTTSDGLNINSLDNWLQYFECLGVAFLAGWIAGLIKDVVLGFQINFNFFETFYRPSFEFDANSNLRNLPFAAEFLSMCIMGPLAEELIFRGRILDLLRTEHDEWTSIMMQGLLFGICHIVNASHSAIFPVLVQVIHAAIVGCFFGFINQKYNSMIPSIFGHTAWNTVNTLGRKTSIIYQTGGALHTDWDKAYFFVLSFVVLCIAMFIVHKVCDYIKSKF